jgi:hypothetical protein
MLVAFFDARNQHKVYGRDIPLAKVMCEHTAQMVQASLASTVSKRLQSWNSQPINATDVNDASWITRRTSLLEKGRKELGEIKDSLKVQSEDSGPCR